MDQTTTRPEQNERTLLVFQSGFGLPSLSPFSTKAMILLAMASLDYTPKLGNPTKAPKKKLPVLVDGGETIPDSHFIRLHIERHYGVDLDEGLDARERAAGAALTALAEDRFYFSALAERWLLPENRPALIATMTGVVPDPLRGVVTGLVARSIRKTLQAQGLGRHSREDALRIGRECIDAFAAHLGDRPFMLGSEPKSADASIYPMLSGNLVDAFRTPLKDAIKAHSNLLDYCERMRERFPVEGASVKQ